MAKTHGLAFQKIETDAQKNEKMARYKTLSATVKSQIMPIRWAQSL